MENELLIQSCRMAFSALIHDIGKFAERAKINISAEDKENNIHIFCPYNKEHQHHSHIHAAYTGIAIDMIEKYLPQINNTDTSPFQTNAKDNSIINAAAMHHQPETYLQSVISVADRLSSAFERTQYDEYNHSPDNENYQQARLMPLFEKLLNEEQNNFNYRYPLSALSPDGIFAHLKKNISVAEAEAEYKTLWNAFLQDVQKLNNRENWSLWLDNFDTLYALYTQNIPSSSYKTLSDVSLYDHSKSTAALATALWRYHYETKTETVEALKHDTENKFLLIQGDVSGIQNYIFEAGKHSRKSAYKFLRGRSFMISLFSECAALKVLEELGLPSTSQIMNAAGKFVIVAPNTVETKQRIQQVRDELNAWFKAEYYGLVSVGIATIEASQQDFENKNFATLQQAIFQSLSVAKMHKFDLCSNTPEFNDFFDNYDKNMGLCCFDGKMPAEEAVSDSDDQYACRRCLDILSLSEHLTRQSCIYIADKPQNNGFKNDILGYYVGWQSTKDAVRIWDISLPNDAARPMFNGYAKRFINAYIPRFTEDDINKNDGLYKDKELEPAEINKPKTFSHLAVENCLFADERLITKPALMCIKGDIDNLGHILQSGTKHTTFATMAGLSRQINNFFAVWLPWLCQSELKARNIYTVFAGGDDFYLIGPWLDMVKILPVLRRKFAEYVCNNPKITFSVGMCMTRSGDDAVSMSDMAESALENAKKREVNKITVKNAVCCFNQVVDYEEYGQLLEAENELDGLYQKFYLSTGYIYDLLALCDDISKVDEDFMRAMWRSKLVYKSQRFIDTNKNVEKEDKQNAVKTLVTTISTALEKYKEKYKIALYIWLYKHREN